MQVLPCSVWLQDERHWCGYDRSCFGSMIVDQLWRQEWRGGRKYCQRGTSLSRLGKALIASESASQRTTGKVLYEHFNVPMIGWERLNEGLE